MARAETALRAFGKALAKRLIMKLGLIRLKTFSIREAGCSDSLWYVCHVQTYGCARTGGNVAQLISTHHEARNRSAGPRLHLSLLELDLTWLSVLRLF